MSEVLEGKTVMITGASRGIGEATGKLIASAGANVFLTSRDAAELERVANEIIASGGNAWFKACDVTSHIQVKELIEFVYQKAASIDVLINNAGGIDPIAKLADSSAKAWSQNVDLNLKGAYFTTQAVLDQMLKQKGGTIINLSSGAAYGPMEGWSHYCCTKAALAMLTRCVHKEYGHQGIRCLGLSPGTVATHMQKVIKDSGINPVSQLDWEQHIPPNWVAKAIVFLCSTKSNDFLGSDFSLKNDQGREMVGLPLTGSN